MSNYTKTVDFAAKDTLPSGDSGKIIKGTEFETEFDNISTAIATKADSAAPTFTGTSVFTNLDINGTVQADGAVTVGVDDTGYDVKFFGATTGKSLLWDESADSLIVTGTTTLVGTTNLDAVDVDGDMTFGDNNKAIFGAGSDLQIYSDGTTGQVTGDVNVTGSVTADGLTVDTDTLVVDATNNRVGIGTSSPATGLHLSGANNVSSSLTLTNTAPDPDNTWTFVPQYNSLDLAVLNNGAERMRIVSSGQTQVVGYDAMTLGFPAVAGGASRSGIKPTVTGAGAGQLQFLVGGDNTTEATTIAAMLDASGNLLVGKSALGTTAGFEVRSAGNIVARRASGEVAIFDRKTNDGEIVRLAKDGTTVGSIGVAAGAKMSVIGTNENLQIGANGVNVFNVSTTSVYPATDNATDLGFNSSTGWKDLYLSGVSYNGDGSAAAPSISFGADTNTGFYRVGSDQIGFVTAGTIKAKLDASGNLLVGVTSTTLTGGSLTLPNSGIIAFHDAGGAARNVLQFVSGNIKHGAAGSGVTTQSFYTDNTLAATIDSSQNLLVGGTSVGDSDSCAIESYGAITIARASGVGRIHMTFTNGGATVGTISTTGSATAYNTSSDQRLKENIVDADDAGSKIDSIQVRKFDWKVDGSHQDYGMVAQELLEVAPEAVHQPQDPEEMMGVDYSKLVPMMLKEIQSLRARVAALES